MYTQRTFEIGFEHVAESVNDGVRRKLIEVVSLFEFSLTLAASGRHRCLVAACRQCHKLREILQPNHLTQQPRIFTVSWNVKYANCL